MLYICQVADTYRRNNVAKIHEMLKILIIKLNKFVQILLQILYQSHYAQLRKELSS